MLVIFIISPLAGKKEKFDVILGSIYLWVLERSFGVVDYDMGKMGMTVDILIIECVHPQA